MIRFEHDRRLDRKSVCRAPGEDPWWVAKGARFPVLPAGIETITDSMRDRLFSISGPTIDLTASRRSRRCSRRRRLQPAVKAPRHLSPVDAALRHSVSTPVTCVRCLVSEVSLTRHLILIPAWWRGTYPTLNRNSDHPGKRKPGTENAILVDRHVRAVVYSAVQSEATEFSQQPYLPHNAKPILGGRISASASLTACTSRA